jgi:hypothetical protein
MKGVEGRSYIRRMQSALRRKGSLEKYTTGQQMLGVQGYLRKDEAVYSHLM